MLNELKEAAEVYEHGKQSSKEYDREINRRSLVRLADPTNNDAKMKLAEIYEILNEPRKALELVYEGISSNLLNRFWSCLPYLSYRLPQKEAPRSILNGNTWSFCTDAIRNTLRRAPGDQNKANDRNQHALTKSTYACAAERTRGGKGRGGAERMGTSESVMEWDVGEYA